MIRTRFAPSPTGYMHIGNLRTALYAYLIAKSKGGKFVLRIEDTDRERLVEGADTVIYKTLKTAGLTHDEGPDIGGPYGPYIQSQRKGMYMDYAKKLVEEKKAFYCFCTKERLAEIKSDDGFAKYDGHCRSLTDEEIARNLADGVPFVIRQVIPPGVTSFTDLVFGTISVDNDEIEEQVLIKSDGLPTYNFANVVDDNLMGITHVTRGAEYLTSTPKYNILYDAFGWQLPTYIHLPLILNDKGEKLSKRRGDASFEDLIEEGFLPEAVVNYIALLGFSPADNREMMSLSQLEQCFDVERISKSPSIFDVQKLTWLNGEYFKVMDDEKFYEMAIDTIKKAVKTPGIDLKEVAAMAKTRINLFTDIPSLVDFIDNLPEYDTALYVHKKMKTTEEIALTSLQAVLPVIKEVEPFDNDIIYSALVALAERMSLKNGQILWPVRTALSGKPSSPCGATELVALLGREESIKRIETGIGKLT